MSTARWVPGIARNPFLNNSVDVGIVTGGYNTEVGPLDSGEIRTLDGRISMNTTIPTAVYSHCTIYLNESTIILIGGVQIGYNYSPKTYYLTNDAWSDGPGTSITFYLDVD